MFWTCPCSCIHYRPSRCIPLRNALNSINDFITTNLIKSSHSRIKKISTPDIEIRLPWHFASIISITRADLATFKRRNPADPLHHRKRGWNKCPTLHNGQRCRTHVSFRKGTLHPLATKRKSNLSWERRTTSALLQHYFLWHKNLITNAI